VRPLDALRTFVAFAVLVLLHYSLRPLLGWQRVSPDFLLVALLVVAVRVRPGAAAVVGLLVGIVADSIGTDPFGAGALAMTVVAFGASWMQQVVFADDLMVNAMLFFFGEWAFSIVFLFASRGQGGGTLVMPLLVWAPLRAAVAALFGVATMMVLRPILRPPDA
jgi:rod shape-determining protein MreD